jgi:hypothetical protein
MIIYRCSHTLLEYIEIEEVTKWEKSIRQDGIE